MDTKVVRIRTSTGARRFLSNRPLVLGLLGSLAMVAGVTAMRVKHKGRRYSDHADDRRNPLNMFAAGGFPRRREIDHSGEHPLFERRQSAYERY